MIKVIMHGASGKMGQTITRLIADDEALEVVAGIDKVDNGNSPYPIFGSIAECDINADVIIDFSIATAVDDLLLYCEKRNVPCVLCTTGLTEEQIDKIKETSEKVAILKSANMSLGINLLLKMLKEAAGVLAPAGFDIEIVEKHHNLKVDAPSGTALALGDSINDELGSEYKYIYDRSQERVKRGKKEIGYSAIRGGTIVGEHDVIFAGCDEIVTFSHTAYSKSVFGKGAIEAAKYLAGKPAGMYTMADVIG
ncbi:MAG: 4-hydroxy-tetrahydrodipicolinate reductase [Lachnospiraceae bacterium]|nr:4-hydroxy-tetrahydrodipicolinate reductase [Lachnospiraceae bacterium]